jgi:hypothetical protein
MSADINERLQQMMIILRVDAIDYHPSDADEFNQVKLTLFLHILDHIGCVLMSYNMLCKY